MQHPDTAKTQGVEDGDIVIVESNRGNLKIKAKLF
jgi:anaerobic selenocysteine-containing dehydrogenase